MGRHVSRPMDGPLIVLFEQDGADEADDGVVVGEDAHDLGSALDLAVDPLDRVGAVELDAMLPGEGHVGQHVGAMKALADLPYYSIRRPVAVPPDQLLL